MRFGNQRKIFLDVNEEIVVELRRYLGTNVLESSICVGYPFAPIDMDALYGRTNEGGSSNQNESRNHR